VLGAMETVADGKTEWHWSWLRRV